MWQSFPVAKEMQITFLPIASGGATNFFIVVSHVITEILFFGYNWDCN
jgi:hypothetical protein